MNETPNIPLSDIPGLVKSLAKYLNIPKLAVRIAEGLGEREIAIVASTPSFSNLKLSLLESGLFEEKNISHVAPEAFDKLESADLILLDYAAIHSDDESAVRAKLAELLKRKDRRDGLIVYCKYPLRIPTAIPREIPADIPAEERDNWSRSLYTIISDTANTVVVTQYGRLLSDILSMMMTTNPQKRG